MTATLTAPATQIQLAAYVPELVRSCFLQPPQPPAPPDDPFPGPQPPGSDPGNYPPVTIIDTSPDRMIGCIIRAAGNPQVRINSLFPDAIEGDGVIERSTLDIWVFDGVLWNNVGPTPGPTIIDAPVIPPWNQTVVVNGITRSKVQVTSFGYALEQLNELPALTVRTGLRISSPVPAISIALTAEAPEVLSGAAIDVPTAGATLNTPELGVVSGGGVTVPAGMVVLSAPDAAIASGASVSVPSIQQAFEVLTPQRVGPPVPATEVAVPVVDLTLDAATPAVASGASVSISVIDQLISALTPVVVGGGSVAVPATDIGLAASVPTVNPISPFWSHQWTALGTDVISASNRFGFSFKVGSTTLTCNTLACYFNAATNERVIIHRDSDGAVIASADITASINNWVSVTVSAFTLSANTSYTISTRATTGVVRSLRRNQTGITFDSRINTISYVSGTADTRPISGTSNAYVNARFGYQ